MLRNRRGLVLGCLVFLGILAVLTALTSGAVPISLTDPTPAHSAVLWNLRIPRILLALLIGSTLAVSGVLIQGLFRNPLADPGLIGVSSGAALGAVIVIVVSKTYFRSVPWLHQPWSLPWGAFAGAAVVCLIIHRLGSSDGRTSVATLLLAGIAINALAQAFIGFATYLATDDQLRMLTFWTLGSLGGANWPMATTAASFCLPVLVFSLCFGSLLNALSLGEAEAAHLGFQVEAGKRLLIALVVVGVGVSVALTGIIGFVGLVVPHVLRLLIGPDHRWLIPGGAILGATLLLTSDTLARTMLAPAELPIGIVTAAFGAPVFLILLWKRRREFLIE